MKNHEVRPINSTPLSEVNTIETHDFTSRRGHGHGRGVNVYAVVTKIFIMIAMVKIKLQKIMIIIQKIMKKEKESMGSRQIMKINIIDVT
jgi:hypothetical protein